jgi:DNA modification methylase
MDTGVLYCDDNLARLRELPSESVDLIYLDPPFFSNRVYEVIWGDEAEVRSFEDRWEGGMQHYIGWMRERVEEMHRVLKSTGSLYLHCDPHASHYLKVMLDDIFTSSMFRNEIVWKRTAAKGSPMGRFPSNHDLILSYSRTGAATWNPALSPYDITAPDAKTLTKYTYVDPDGRRFRLGPLLHPEQGRRPNLHYEIMGVTRTWRWTKDRMEQAIRDGVVIQTAPGRVPQSKLYLDAQKGRTVDDVWTDISPLNSQAKERLGYPTQKPEALLERIILASSNKEDVVLDPFCGCGTPVTVAERLGRAWVGIDISPTAMEIMKRRYWRQTREWPRVVNTPDSEAALRQLKPFEFQNWIINAVNGSHSARKVHDFGIDGYWWFTRDPIQVKQSDHVGRPVVDSLVAALHREKADTGYIIAFSFSRGAHEEVARVKKDGGIDIRLLTVKQVLISVRRDTAPRAFGPQPDANVVPLPSIRKRDELPTAEELVASDQAVASA